ncbi:hypothetical protein L6164_012211 [Bauhinia variegata]|uniref:Uncharacterized protein n=1 Tax=Bauhinia variegata TaxID=167791 RepID=A0ACB9P9E6_BAUVA|nr:hypothetical protein L6164_012211 [Bauhinia variegata]
MLGYLSHNEMVVQVEGRTCEAPSGKFTGPCIVSISNPNCNNVCKNEERLLSGICKKDLRCYCTRNC